MREHIEFRIPEEHAIAYLPPGTGDSIGYNVRRVILDTSDPLFAEIGRIHRMFRARGKYFFSGREYRRNYSQRELLQAFCLHVWPMRVFEPSGEECGTTYAEELACPECGAGARQSSPLYLDGRRIPKGIDFARTIAGEIVVSRRVVDTFQSHGLTGVDFGSVLLSSSNDMPSEDYFQFCGVGDRVDLDPVTRVGEDPYDETAYGRCTRGHVIGLNLLSEVTVQRRTMPDADVIATRQMVGARRGLLRPLPVLLFSSNAWRVTKGAALTGLAVEIARVV